MQVAIIATCAVLGVVVGLLLPRPTYRLAVPSGAPYRLGCHHCDEPFRLGLLGWVTITSNCVRCHRRFGPPWWTYSSGLLVTSTLLAWRISPLHPPNGLALLAMWLVVLYAGVLISGIDLAAHRLPSPVLTGTGATVITIITIASLVSDTPALLLTALASGFVMGSSYLLLALVAGGMGMGDVRLAVVLGIALGTIGWRAVIVGAALPYVLATPMAVGRMVRSRRLIQELPFGPFLVAGALLAATVIPS